MKIKFVSLKARDNTEPKLKSSTVGSKMHAKQPHLLPVLPLHSLDKNQFIVTQNTASVMASNRVGSTHTSKCAELWSGLTVRSLP